MNFGWFSTKDSISCITVDGLTDSFSMKDFVALFIFLLSGRVELVKCFLNLLLVFKNS